MDYCGEVGWPPKESAVAIHGENPVMIRFREFYMV
jgi:hypothetical protein